MEKRNQCGRTEGRHHLAVTVFLTAGKGAAQTEEQLCNGWEDQEQKRDDRPVERSAGKSEPSSDKQEEKKRLDKRAPQVVEDLPA